jgi:BirA family biotin operon repressor/biotin-[acetyl-CoA-carboxylase] ligase
MNYKIDRRASVESTMDAVHFLARQNAPEGTAVLADEQTAGRGRASHEWFSPPGQAIYVSVLLRPMLAPAQLGWITMIAALAARETVASFAPNAQTGIKWFNDVLLNAKKVCGILVETSFLGQTVEYAALGMGLNVNTEFANAPDILRSKATSLRAETGAQQNAESVLQNWLMRFNAQYTKLLAQRQSPAREYARHLVTLGQQTTIHAAGRIYQGLAKRIEDDGALILDMAGKETRVGFGEVV